MNRNAVKLCVVLLLTSNAILSNALAISHNTGIAIGDCNMDLSSSIRYEQVAAPFFYSGTPSPSVTTVPAGAYLVEHGRNEFEQQCISYFRNVCTIYPTFKGSKFDKVSTFSQTFSHSASEFNLFINEYAYHAAGFADRYTSIMGFGDATNIFKNLQCYPIDTPKEVSDLASVPHPNYVYPLSTEIAQDLVQFKYSNIQHNGVIDPPTPLTGSAYGYDVRLTIEQAQELGLLELKMAGDIAVTTAGLSAIVWLAQNGEAISGAWKVAVAAGDAQAIVLASRILWPIAVLLTSTSFSTAYNNVLEKPWTFADIPDNQKEDIVNNYPNVLKVVQDFHKNLTSAILFEVERRRADANRTIFTPLNSNIISTAGKDIHVPIYIPTSITTIRLNLYKNDGSEVSYATIARPETGTYEHTFPSNLLKEKGLYYIGIRSTGENKPVKVIKVLVN